MHGSGTTRGVGIEGRWIFFLLIGVLSMLYAELFSGASHMWYLDGWSLLVTFPLYLAHVLFFLNLAFSTGKTSLTHLYLWGILFGLYESWITQVLWMGYNAQGPLIGTVLGIGIGEFLALVFFWHPILSFILPIFMFEVLCMSVSPDNHRILASHMQFLQKRSHTRKILVGLYVVGSLFMAVNYQGNVFLAVGALGGTYLILYVLYWRGRTAYPDSFSIHSLELGMTGKRILLAYLIVLYAAMFFGFGYLQGRIPGLLPVITTLMLYILFGSIISFSRDQRESPVIHLNSADYLNILDFRNLAVFNIASTVIFCFGFLIFPSLLSGLFMVFYYGMCLVGTGICIKVLIHEMHR
jgi:hypothetical protein